MTPKALLLFFFMLRHIRLQLILVVAVIVSPALTACNEQYSAKNAWGPVVELRDDTDRWPEGKPSGGWWVTPIHATLLPNGKVLIAGWGRRDYVDCTKGGDQRNGTSFLLDPSTVISGTLKIVPLDEQGSTPTDVLFCGGHAPLADGRILYAGGQRHGKPDMGLNYARLYHPNENSFTRIDAPMSGGPGGEEGMRWYPTATRLADSRVLVTGGFTRYGDSKFGNLSIELFDELEYNNGTHPWQLLIPHSEGLSDMTPGIHDYTHVHLLPVPVPAARGNGFDRRVVMFGGSGTMLLFNYNDELPVGDRFMVPPHGHRGGRGDGSTGALMPTGEILVLGGTGDHITSQRADFYHPHTDTWSSVDTLIGRWHPASVLLPDGTVLIVNGEAKPGFPGDQRQPQTIDPITHKVTTWPAWPDDSRVRGYHNIAILLKDGRVLLGGGIDPEHSTFACERPDVRIYSPAYLEKGPRPTLVDVDEPVQLTVGGPEVSFNYTNGTIRSGNGVVLMAVGATTHAFDQNQRYIVLDFKVSQSGVVRVVPPADYFQAPAGDYILFVVSEAGVPSKGKHVRLS